MSKDTQDKPCNCFNDQLETNKRLLKKEHFIPDTAAEIVFNWKNVSHNPDKSDISTINPIITYEFQEPKKGKPHAKFVRSGDIEVLAKYCCFCGRKYQRNE